MATKKKLLQAAAGNAGGAALDVDEVFSTYLYSGNSTARNISNGIDLSGEGGLVWTKLRGPNTSTRHVLIDTERGVEKYLESNTGDAEDTQSGNSLTAFNNNGYTIGNWGSMNASSQDYASWTFRKAKKFFDVVTYTGDGTVGRNVSHNLGSKPGCVIVKKTSGSEGWFVSHRGYNSGANTGYLNMTNAFTAGFSTEIPVYYATDTTFRVSNISGQSYANTNGATYVAYIFAHNDGDGEFAADGNADIIKCGSYTNSGSAWSVDLGFEPQFLLRKLADGTSDWQITDTMRGLYPKGQNAKNLRANTSNAETNAGGIQITPTGIEGTGNGATGTWIYIAIRRPTAVPETATEVFAISQQLNTSGSTPSYNSGFPVDMAINKYTTGADAGLSDRLRGAKDLQPAYNFAEYANGVKTFDYMDGYYSSGAGANSNNYSWMWKRAPNYFDVVAYNGDATSSPNSRNINHNLGVAPEMMWIKCRTAAENWAVYHSGTGATKYLNLNNTAAAATSANWWRNTAPTDTVFTIGHQDDVNLNGGTHIAYLFATLAGISKVGSATHSGTTNVDCGFSSGARFVLLKRTDATGDWYVWDSERGIVSGNDPYLLLNSTAAEVTNTDYIDPLSSGFTITSNFTAGDYIFYAIA